VLATLWFGRGGTLAADRRDAIVEAAREAAAASPLAATCGTTAPDARLVIVRALADRVEPAMRLLQTIRAAWRGAAWGLPEAAPRVWRT
jgi:urease accessory protein